jgi:hypothetical protein
MTMRSTRAIPIRGYITQGVRFADALFQQGGTS